MGLTSALSGPGAAQATRRRRDNLLRPCGALAPARHGPLQRIVRSLHTMPIRSVRTVGAILARDSDQTTTGDHIGGTASERPEMPRRPKPRPTKPSTLEIRPQQHGAIPYALRQ